MATVEHQGVSLIIELDHEETQKLLNVAKGGGGVAGITTVLTGLGIAAFTAGIVAAAIALHIAWESAAIAAADKGDGVLLEAPFFPFAGAVLIPHTRTAPPPNNQDWFTLTDAVIGSSDNDRVNVHIEHGVIPGAVRFNLRNRTPECWDKSLHVFDTNGSKTEITAAGCSDADYGLYPNELAGARIEFWKPKFLGTWAKTFTIYGLDKLNEGDNVVFEWVTD